MSHLNRKYSLRKVGDVVKIYNFENSCINNYMSNSQFKRGELYSVINGMASTAVARASAGGDRARCSPDEHWSGLTGHVVHGGAPDPCQMFETSDI